MKSLWNESYRTWWAVLVATAVANWGGGILGIVVTWTVLSESRSILAIAFISFLGFYPHVLFGVPVAVWVDRWPKKPVMVVTTMLRGLLVIATGVLVWRFGTLPPWLGDALVLALAGASLFYGAAIGVVLRLLVQDEHLPVANGMNQAVQNTATVAVWALGGFMVLTLGVLHTLWVVGATLLFESTVLAVLRLPSVQSDTAAPGRNGYWHQMAAGWRFLRNDPILWRFVLVAVLINFGFGFDPVLGPSLSRFLLHAGILGYSGIGLAAGIGGIVGGLIGPRVARQFSLRVWTVSFVGMFAVSLVVIVAYPSIWLFMVIALLSAVLSAIRRIPFNAALQRMVPPEELARVSRTHVFLQVGVSLPVALFGGAWLAEVVGLRTVLLGNAAVVALIAWLVWRWMPHGEDHPLLQGYGGNPLRENPTGVGSEAD